MCTTTLGLAYIFQKPFISRCVTTCVIYVWSRKHPTLQMNIMGVFNIRAPYFPLMFIIPGLYMPGNIFYNMSGFIMGHVYYFFDDIMPALPFANGF